MAAFQILRVSRIGQISAATWPNLVDSIGQPLLTDTGNWNVIGVDEDASVLHPDDGRTFVFFGDSATDKSGKPLENGDPIAWFREDAPLRNSGILRADGTFSSPSAALASKASRIGGSAPIARSCSSLRVRPDGCCP